MALAGLEIPESIVSGLREGLGDGLLAVVLLGSRARGEAREGSDWDFLVVARDLPERALERAFRLKKMLPPLHRGETMIASSRIAASGGPWCGWSTIWAAGSM